MKARKPREETYRLNCFVENRPGVLARIVGLISGRGYNIQDRKSTRLNSSHQLRSRMPSSA